VHFQADSSGMQIDTHVAHTLLRMVQESAQNSLKHAGCKNIHIGIETRGNPFMLRVSDDGKGFDMDAAAAGPGIGLKSIQKRAGIIGATLVRSSAPGKGTLITITLSQNNLST
jgi:signal transduction histidine kinase